MGNQQTPPSIENKLQTITYNNGDKYEGNFILNNNQQGQSKGNVREGNGVYICFDKENKSNYEYDGQWKANMRDGVGKCMYYNGELYYGQWKNNKKHGKGTYFYKKGERYEGEWVDDMREGEGVLWSANNTQFKGFFKADKKHGEGKIVTSEGVIYHEMWNNGLLISHFKIEEAAFSSNSSYSPKKNQRSFNASIKDQNASLRTDQNRRTVNYDNLSKTTTNKDYRKKQRSFHDKMIYKASFNQTALEEIDSFSRITSILLKNNNVNEWKIEEVVQWLQANQFDQLVDLFKSNHIDGYALLNLTEHDLQNSLKLDQEIQRKTILKQIKRLIEIWKNFNKDEPHEVQSEIFSDDLNLTLNKLNLSHNNTPLKKLDQSQIDYEIQHRITTQGQNRKLSFLNNQGAQQKTNKLQMNLAPLLVKTPSGVYETSRKNTDVYEDDEEQVVIGDIVGNAVYKSLKNSGFNFMIDFNEMIFDSNKDHIGTGLYGDVFVGKWLGVKVAIKRFVKIYTNTEALKGFIQEIEVLHSLRHPNIILYMGVSFDLNQQYYMITEYATRGSLYDLIHVKKFVLDEERVFKIAKQIAIALCYLHKKKIMHCDLKSQNILVCDDWCIKLCDFGYQRYIQFQQENMGKTTVPSWIAPEILRGESYEEASDVYSFGVVLWEMITGKIPYEGRSYPQLTGLVGYIGNTLIPPQTCNKQLKKIINNCLLFEPERRPGFEDIVKYLEKIEKQPKFNSNNPFITNLKDFLN